MLDPNDLRAEADRLHHATGSAALREAAGEIERLRLAYDTLVEECRALAAYAAMQSGALARAEAEGDVDRAAHDRDRAELRRLRVAYARLAARFGVEEEGI